MNYSKLSDEELVFLAQKKDGKAVDVLLDRYKGFVKTIIRPYFICGGDSDDLLQEGMIGVFHAIDTFDNKIKFKSYAGICIKRAIVSLIRKYNTEKNKPLNNFISLSGLIDNEDKNIYVTNFVDSPETEYIYGEDVKDLLSKIKDTLSTLEFKILELFLDGYSYQEISQKLSKKEKSIDNALQRIRKKVVNVFGEQ